MSKELQIGVIGAGGRGGIAQLAHSPDDGVRLTAGADTDLSALEKFRQKMGSDVYTTSDYREILAKPEIDAVFITTPDFLHEEHAIAALEAGKAVYLEKPMAITIEGCDRILEAAARLKGKLYLGHNMRHFPMVLKMKELISKGAIGKPMVGWCRHFVCYGGDAYFKDWHAERAKSTGLLLQKAAHDIDILHWLMGGYTTRVTAMGALTLYDRITDRHDPAERGDASWHNENWPPLSQVGLNPVIDVEDVSMMLMRLDNGTHASYQQCHYAPDGWRNYTIIGEAGRIENFGDLPGESVVRLWDKKVLYKAEGDAEFPIPEVEGTHGGADPSIVAEFIAYVRGEAKPTTSPIGARFSVAAGVKATESIRDNSNPKDVPPAPAEARDWFDRETAHG
ncbi:MAG: Gfo/Idh/MocA family oxidoreductase [Armatimonadetes bacterium]|nr:Gfo/Idh/MocA family oxidoreductase [Armatimonadota bacterium]